MGKLCLKLMLFLPVIALLVGVNYVVDPANLYHKTRLAETSSSIEESIAAYNASGYHVTNVETFDERVFQKYRIISAQGAPDITVLGTSRSQLIGENVFPGSQLINSSVTGATVEDILGIINIYDSTKRLPARMIIELAPWYLNENNNQTRWKSISNDYNTFNNKITSHQAEAGPVAERFFTIDPRIYEIVSFSYFQNSLEALFRKEDQNRIFFKADEFQNGYTASKFFERLVKDVTPDVNPSNTGDTLAILNSYLENVFLYDSLQKKYGDQELPEEFLSMLQEINSVKGKRWDNLSSIERQSLSRFNRKILEFYYYEVVPASSDPMTYPTRNTQNRGLTRNANGTVTYPENFRKQSVDEVRSSVKSFLTTPVFGLDEFRSVSEYRLRQMENTLDYLLTKHIDVTLLLVPYHPMVYNELQNIKYQNVFAAENAFRSLASKKGLKIVGSYDPNKCKLTEKDFYDAMHPKEYTFNQIIKTEL
jgi:hypothetical protein